MVRSSPTDERRIDDSPTETPAVPEDALAWLFDGPAPRPEGSTRDAPVASPAGVDAGDPLWRLFDAAVVAPAPDEPRTSPAASPESGTAAGSDAALDSGAADPIPFEITADDVRAMFERAYGAVEEAERTPADPPVETQSGPRVDPPTPAETQCPSCYGSGTRLCSSCGGSGSHTTSYTTTDWDGSVEYVTDQYPCGCSGGTVSCGRCGGRGTVPR